MAQTSFNWTTDLAEEFFSLRLKNDWLFRKKKQPWKDFRAILIQNGFPEEITLDHIRKKWTYTFDTYRLAKKSNNKNWIYYHLFEKYLSNNKILDKYDSWSDEWRLKLINAYTNGCEEKLNHENHNAIWRYVEKKLRSQNLPNDCCIQDLKGLWQHLRTTFHRKHRLKLKKGTKAIDWALYDSMLYYYEKLDVETLKKLENEGCISILKHSRKKFNAVGDTRVDTGEFQWTRDITETFIQVRLQNEWLFKERKWAWSELQSIMQDSGFPKGLTGRMLCHKWSSIFAEYQKAKATNNNSWLYYNLFELYLGEDYYNIDPLKSWQEKWVLRLICAKIELEDLFSELVKPYAAWRELEKKLRAANLPIDHSVVDLPELWAHLVKTYKWKHKFATKGILSENWPYYEAMENYHKVRTHIQVKQKTKPSEQIIMQDDYNENDINDDYEDDIKLFDLKQQLQMRNVYKEVETNLCRTCNGVDGCISLYEPSDDDGLDLACKLRVICGVEIDKWDGLPSYICLNCLQELENAYKFRRKCQEIDRQYRNDSQNKFKNNESTNKTEEKSSDVKIEFLQFDTEPQFQDISFSIHDSNLSDAERPSRRNREVPKIKNCKKERKKYDYRKICEVCGKHTRNMKIHMDSHTDEKLYKCDACKKSFKYKSGLVLHKATHNPTPRKTCEICGKSFHILSQYKRHFVYHANERKYSCDTCGKAFNTKDILVVHKRMHNDIRPFSCSECGKTFRTAGCVARHKRIVHKKTVKI